MTSREQFDVAIVGMGPVGAVAANLCGQAGFRALVIERGFEPYDLPRAIHFDAEIMRIFQSIGLGEPIAAATRPLGGSVYLGSDGRPIRKFQSQDTRSSLGWPASNLFYQPRLEALLREALKRYPNVDVRLGHELTTLTQGSQGTILGFGPVDGTECREVLARFVLACDGASSPTRKLLGIPLEDMGFEERWLVVDALVNGPMCWPSAYEIPAEVRGGGYSLMVCDPSRPTTVIPGSGQHRRWEYMLLPHESDEAVMEPSQISSLLSDWIDPANVQVVRAAVYRFHALVARHWRMGNVFLLGDAAHQTPPFFGQGMCHGIRDAAQLIWKLRLVHDGLAAPDLLDTYQEERDAHVRTIIAASVVAGAAVCILDPPAATARDERFRAEEATRGDSTVAMTDVVPRIHAGIIDSRTGGLRLPQPLIQDIGRPDLRLDDLLAGRFAVLTFDTTPLEELAPDAAVMWRALGGRTIRFCPPSASPAQNVDPDVASAILDLTGALRDWMTTLPARWVVVRPDRYLFGTASTSAQLSSLLDLLPRKLRWAPGAARTGNSSLAPTEMTRS
jgi:3-(3-hydroxy-phenyl)propionate hydroxylase